MTESVQEEPYRADAAPNLAAASALLTEHQLGAEAERALDLTVEADLTTEQQNEMDKLGEFGRVSNEKVGPSG